MNLSLVITTYNRADGLQRLLNTLALQDNKNFQVVVAIDGSTDSTEEILVRQSQPYDLKWINTGCQKYGLALARNQGILASDGRAVVILDDDSFPCPGFVQSHLESVIPGVITGGPRYPSDPVAAPRMAWKMSEMAKLPPCTPMTFYELRRNYPNAWLIENNACMLREDWIKMGLFSERLKMYGYIGQEFFGRAAHLGLYYQYNPKACLVHHCEMEGDNGFNRSRKTRETKLATIIRPSLMKPNHYKAQIDWAQAVANGVAPPKMPSYACNAVLFAPFRLLGLMLSHSIRILKASIKRFVR